MNRVERNFNPVYLDSSRPNYAQVGERTGIKMQKSCRIEVNYICGS